MTLVVGLTGGIGSGKSIVADAFAGRGVDVTDTDRLAHALTAPGEPGHSAVLAAFGPSFRRTDGTLDRARLRQVVFTHADARGALEGILHPLIREAAGKEMARWTGPYDHSLSDAAKPRAPLASTAFSSSIVPKTSRFAASRREAH